LSSVSVPSQAAARSSRTDATRSIRKLSALFKFSSQRMPTTTSLRRRKLAGMHRDDCSFFSRTVAMAA
jgi:hypothetical protein